MSTRLDTPNFTDMTFVIAPIEGLHLTTDFSIYSAELYGCPPNYKPEPQAYHVYREVYNVLIKIPFNEIYKLSDPNLFLIDTLSLENVKDLPRKTLQNYTCVAFEIYLPNYSKLWTNDTKANNGLFQHLLDHVERIIDVLRFFIFEPGDDNTIGKVGALGNGVYGLWLGKHEGPAKFIARKVTRYQLVGKPLTISSERLTSVHFEFGFRYLAYLACNPDNRDPMVQRVFQSLQALRESRDLISWEAKFRHLATAIEYLSKREDDERLQGPKLRKRIATLAKRGWKTYDSYGLTTLLPPPHAYQSIKKRHDAMEWASIDELVDVVSDLWTNVRNPFSHTLQTFTSIGRDPIKDIGNLERILFTLVNGLMAAREVGSLLELPAYDYLLQDEQWDNNFDD